MPLTEEVIFMMVFSFFGFWRMKQVVFVAMMGILLISHPVWAEMYRYRDAGGVVRFTDNLANVPEKQRAGMSIYENEPSPAAPSATETLSGQNAAISQSLKAPEKSESIDSAADSPQSVNLSNDPSRIDQLLKIKTALDAENAQFAKESLALSEEKKTLFGNAAIKAFNEKISALNARVEDYEKRRAAFQKEADAFDAAINKRLTPPPQSAQPSSP
jgi:hypothetical protein